MPFLTYLVAAAIAYLIGTFSWSYLAVRVLRGEDLRQHGSGNLGATNAGRVLGRRWAFLIYLADMLKGLLPTLAAKIWWQADSEETLPLALVVGLGVILGHLFPFWLSFRGGKGIAAGSGVVLAISLMTGLAALGIWGICILCCRWVSLSSVLATMSLSIVYTLISRGDPGRPWFIAYFVLLAVVVLVSHRANLVRVFRGKEKKIGDKA
ncbi:MAG: glycerol-3-phosphate 1-O-acyltransferase PlsY [Planctomycetota bacterium]